MTDPLIAIENLTVSFAVGGVLHPAVKDLSLTLHASEVVGLVGESGSGKSTALLAVMSYLPGNAVVEAGRVLHGGVDLLRASRETLDDVRGRRIAMIYQDPTTALNPAMTVGAQIAEVLARHLSMEGARARERTHELLRLVQLDDPPRVAAAHPHQLSGGMQQRVMIAMALAGEPDVLLMDEPTTALDVIVQARVLDLVRTLHRQIRSAIVFVSHNLAAVAQLADRIGVLYAGELMELGPAAQGFGGAEPSLHARTHRRRAPDRRAPAASGHSRDGVPRSAALHSLCLRRPLRLHGRHLSLEQAGAAGAVIGRPPLPLPFCRGAFAHRRRPRRARNARDPRPNA